MKYIIGKYKIDFNEIVKGKNILPIECMLKTNTSELRRKFGSLHVVSLVEQTSS